LPATRDKTQDMLEFADELVGHGLLVRSDVPGVCGRGPALDAIVAGLEARLSEAGRTADTEVWSFPPVISRRTIERSQFLNSFPQLVGTVHSFEGDAGGHASMLARIAAQEDWGTEQSMTDLVLTPAVCYHVYPSFSGTLPPEGRVVDAHCQCFRREPSPDPARMQSFRMREFVFAGDRASALAWRASWQERASELMRSLGLRFDVEPAADPFFGPGARLLAASQRDEGLKFELLAAIATPDEGSPIMSFNYHRDHFGTSFHIRTSGGDVAHTSCIGFGLERMALALVRQHGFALEAWPGEVRERIAT
jgi:seryl-tRNA synthetase